MEKVSFTFSGRQADNPAAQVSGRLNSRPRTLLIVDRRPFVNHRQPGSFATDRIRSRLGRNDKRLVFERHPFQRAVSQSRTLISYPRRQHTVSVPRLVEKGTGLPLPLRQHIDLTVSTTHSKPQTQSRNQSRKTDLAGLQNHNITVPDNVGNSLQLGVTQPKRYAFARNLQNQHVFSERTESLNRLGYLRFRHAIRADRQILRKPRPPLHFPFQ